MVTLPETSKFAKTLWILGCALSSIVYGILLVLAHSCFTALRKRRHRNPRINRCLIGCRLLVVMIGTAVEVIDIKQTLYGVLDDTCLGAYLHVSRPYAGPIDIVAFLMTLLTDGVLVSAQFLCVWALCIHNNRSGDVTLLPKASRRVLGSSCRG